MKSILILLTLTVSATAADRCYTAEGKRVRCIDAPPSLSVDNRQARPIRQMPDKLSGNGQGVSRRPPVQPTYLTRWYRVTTQSDLRTARPPWAPTLPLQ